MKLLKELYIAFLSIYSQGTLPGIFDDYGHDHDHDHFDFECGAKSLTSDQKQMAIDTVREYERTLHHAQRAGNATEVHRLHNFEFDVYFHIIMDDEGKGDIRDCMIEYSIDLLNEAYSGHLKRFHRDCNGDLVSGVNTNITFNLKNISRTKNEDWFHIKRDEFLGTIDQNKQLRVGGCSDLNIFTMTSDLYGGWATDPLGCDVDSWAFIDGIWVDYNTFPRFILDRRRATVLIHEVGHWVGLEHVFEGECGDYFGDGVRDTPYQKEVKGCPAVSDTCENKGVDSIHNYMAYTSSCCKHEFTLGQIKRMHALLNRWRIDPVAPPNNWDDFYDFWDDDAEDDFFQLLFWSNDDDDDESGEV